ncbi:MAG: CPBP family intramembrane metalloprotease [Acidobacteria bacterium]|nr:CPBP family intramembrane metalloprotease [Acidobacteriota bacterium]
MSDDRPDLPEPQGSEPPGAPDARRPLPPAAPWGVAGVMLGLAPVLAITLLPLLAGVTADPEALESLTLQDRYLGFLFVQGFLAAIALAAALALRTGLAGLGLSRPRSAGALFFPALGGVGLVGLSTLWALGLERFAPSAYAEMMAEQAEQMGLLEAPLALLVAAAVIVAPLSEELYFRGFIYGGLRRDLPFAFASGLSAAIFAGVHLMAWSTAPLFLVGLGTAIAYERYRTLWAPVALHAAFNGAALAVELLAGPAPK